MQFVIEPRPLDDPDVIRMIDEVQAEYVVRYGGPDLATVDVTEFSPPGGLFVVGLVDGVAVAMGGWRRGGYAATGEAEIKRMFVVAAARRRGLARLLLAELERTAAEAGVRRIILGTGDRQPEAIALYVQAGYEPSTGFGEYSDQNGAYFYAKAISRG